MIPVAGIQEQAAPSGAVATNALLGWSLEKGRRIKAVWLEFLTAAGAAVARSAIESEVSNIEWKASTSPLWDQITPARVHALMNFFGAAGTDGPADDGVLRLDSAMIPGAYEPNYPAGGRAIVDGEALAAGTQGQGAIQIQVRMGTVTTVSQIRCYVEYGDGDEETGLVRRVVVSDESGWGTSKRSLNLQMRAVKTDGGMVPDRLLGIHITAYGAGVLDQVDIYQKKTLVQRYYSTTLGRALRRLHRTAQSGYYHLELSRDGTILGGLPLDPDAPARVDLTWSTGPGSNQFVAILDKASYWAEGNAG